MKKSIILVIAIIISSQAFSQLQLATLDHEDNITVYYGSDAFIQAHNAAVAGDIITLSSGTFNACDITKAVSIRGAGMYRDTATGTDPTILRNDITITIENDDEHHLNIEGIYFGNNVKYDTIYNPQFFKCYFESFYQPTDFSVLMDASFINCLINSFNNTRAQNTKFINSVVLSILNVNIGNPSFLNSIARLDPSSIYNVTITNSIVYYSYTYHNGVNAYYSFNSIGINTQSSIRYFDATGLTNHNLHNYYNLASVFKNFRGSFGDNITFELLDEVAATCLGNDGTQVGVYGGDVPFDPSVHNTMIGKLTVGRRTNSEGKLEVNVEILGE